jgi:hypothetical protein
MTQVRALTKRSSVFTVTTLAGLLMIGGCASAATNTSTAGSPDAAHTSPSTAASPAGPQASRASGPVQITGYSNNDGPESTVILTGAIGDVGVAVRTYANGKIERNYNQLDLTVTHGSFRLSIAGLENDLVSAFRSFPSNTSTCSGMVTVTGMTPIVAGSGTGAYKGISGTFKTTITIHEVDSWPKCTGFLAEEIFTAGSGTVSFG